MTILLLALALLVHPRAVAAEPSAWKPLAGLEATSWEAGSGLPDYAPRIFNGTAAADFPAVAGIGVQFSQVEFGLCTGTLVAPDVVLTAAHCVDRPSRRVVAVFVRDGVQENHPVAAVAVHPGHVAGTLRADVALLRLATPVQGVTPLPIARAKPRPGRSGTIVGFGEDGLGGIGLRQAGTVRLGRCPRALRRAGLVPLRRFVCWRADRGGANTCDGDSGGPLLVNGHVAGVTLGGTATTCGPSQLSVETSTAAFRAWIEAQLR